ncbi:unnamed protein product [Protopolystoma xenopodis]|uniref:Rho-GAP domain-containing protein n=1 Tax=Protopolystoma xenopodis TaxID=117903 RepID=A0A448WRR2_9PLAT|nr:unnamed protein product [Protopolystoma xenopodis]
MSVENLASIFAPNFLRQADDDPDIEISASSIINLTVAGFIRHHERLFPRHLLRLQHQLHSAALAAADGGRPTGCATACEAVSRCSATLDSSSRSSRNLVGLSNSGSSTSGQSAQSSSQATLSTLATFEQTGDSGNASGSSSSGGSGLSSLGSNLGLGQTGLRWDRQTNGLISTSDNISPTMATAVIQNTHSCMHRGSEAEGTASALVTTVESLQESSDTLSGFPPLSNLLAALVPRPRKPGLVTSLNEPVVMGGNVAVGSEKASSPELSGVEISSDGATFEQLAVFGLVKPCPSDEFNLICNSGAATLDSAARRLQKLQRKRRLVGSGYDGTGGLADALITDLHRPPIVTTSMSSPDSGCLNASESSILSPNDSVVEAARSKVADTEGCSDPFNRTGTNLLA